MPQIENAEEARSVARLIQNGQITGANRDTAMQALRDFDAKQSAPASPSAPPPRTGLDRAALAGRAIGEGVASAATTLPDTMVNNPEIGGMLPPPFNLIANAFRGTGKTPMSLLTGGRASTLQEGLEKGVTALGAPTPATRGEELASAAVKGVSAGLAGGGAAGLRGVPNAVRTAVGGATGGTAAELARQHGAPPAIQMLAGLAGGIAPSAVEFGVPAAVRAMRGTRPAPPTAEEVVSRINSPQSMGAASAAPSLVNVSPELRQAIVTTAQKTGGAINPEVLARHTEADTLPVRIRLTEGQAMQSPRLISQEMNTRGNTGMVEHLNTQNRQLAENVRAIRDEVGPDVFSTNATEHGDALIDAYKAKDAAAQADIRAKYKALADANGGNLPVNGPAFVDAASAALKKNMKAPFLPSPVKKILAGLRRGEPMTMENFENLRTMLASEGRKADRAGDGNAAAAVSLVRNALEDLPIEGQGANIKSLADAARSAAKARFDALRADPAYKAAVDETVPADRFVQRFVINGTRDNLATMRENLDGNQGALQTMGVAALDHLRDQARLNPNYEGNFAAASFNKALTQLSPKLSSLVTPATVEQLEKLGNVSRYVTAQPRGSYVNNSNTFTAQAAEYGAQALEGAANVAAHGVPLGTWAGRAIRSARQRRAIQQSMAPGAGLGRLEEPTP